MKKILIFSLVFLAFIKLQAKNPIESPTFDYILKETIGTNKYIFDDKIVIKVPKFGDNPVQVPIYVDASKIKGAKKIIIFADLNPIWKILEMEINSFLPIFGTNIKVAQETPLRVLVKDSEGLWHIGSANINSNGGGCDISSQAASNSNYSDNLGKTKGKVFNKKEHKKIKFSIFHPMETGLVFGSESFFIKKIEINNEQNELLTTLITSAAISENPRITLETKNSFEKIHIDFFDNQANEFKLDLP